jgi:hypothetical protein
VPSGIPKTVERASGLCRDKIGCVRAACVRVVSMPNLIRCDTKSVLSSARLRVRPGLPPRGGGLVGSNLPSKVSYDRRTASVVKQGGRAGYRRALSTDCRP